jgi:hypothetical protein
MFSGLMSVGMFSLGALQLPSWARLRQQQMKELAERLVAEAPPSQPLIRDSDR